MGSNLHSSTPNILPLLSPKTHNNPHSTAHSPSPRSFLSFSLSLPKLTPSISQSPQLLAILAALQLESDRASYASMTSLTQPQPISLLPMNDIHDPAKNGRGERTVAEEWQEVRRELSAVINVVASMGAVGTAVWWVGGGRSLAARLMLSLGGAVAIAAIEAFLYWRFFTRDSYEIQQKKKGRGKVLAFDHRMPEKRLM
ncbi:hypothetical protein P7C70_g4703, partial [Phenoliferia sp. Uapishka_3]